MAMTPADVKALKTLRDEIRGMATAAAMAGNTTLAEVFKRWADELDALLQGAGPEEQPIDLGPYPRCPQCHGTGECSNAQFRCPCRWSTSSYRPRG
jgi:hypothetical protein